MDGLTCCIGLARAGSSEAHLLGVELEEVVADLGNVKRGFEIEHRDFEEEGKWLYLGDLGGVDSSRIEGEVIVGKAELFQIDHRAFGFEREALFFRAGGGNGLNIGLLGHLVCEESLDDQVGVAADRAGEMAIVFQRKAVVADVLGRILGQTHASNEADR